MKRNAVFSICIIILFSACTRVQNPAPKDYIPYGMSDNLPVFYEQLKESLKFPMAWENTSIKNYEEWQKEARAITLSCMMTPPPKTDFDPKIISREKKDGYETQKLVLNISALFWGERGRKEGVLNEAQEILAVNLLQMGMSQANSFYCWRS